MKTYVGMIIGMGILVTYLKDNNLQGDFTTIVSRMMVSVVAVVVLYWILNLPACILPSCRQDQGFGSVETQGISSAAEEEIVIANGHANIVRQNFGMANVLKDILKIIKFVTTNVVQEESMTSFGERVDESINNGHGPYVFKILGQIYHWIRTLCPFDGDPPRLFRTARDKCRHQAIPDFKVRLYSVLGARQYDLPNTNTLGAIVFDDGQNTETDYDVIIESRDGFPQRINKLHVSYMSLQFPLIFIYGQPGFHIDLKLRTADEKKRLTMNMFYMYQLHERYDSYGFYLESAVCFNNMLLASTVASNKIGLTITDNIRKDYLSGIYDAISRGDRQGSEIGSRIILPMSFTGGPRYMYSHYLDALAICRVLGNPQYFITFTCNANWPEIKRYMEGYPNLLSGDRADVVVRVFQQKVYDFCNYLSSRRLFGTVTGLLYTIEFQKRGLPHCHTLLWVDDKDKIQHAADIDHYISAELPDPSTDPEGYKIISEMMVHGPCGPADPTATCMKENVCSKKFPKKFNNETFFDKDGYVHYRRRNTSVEVTRRGMDLDNSYTVPYNQQLCLTFHAHINVEYCGWSMLIKYLFKYISKGTDRVVAQITRPVGESSEPPDRSAIHVDEIQNFVDGRFICPYEACWRILKFEIHSRHPAVQKLSVHLENKQVITFRDRQPLQFIANNDEKKMTTLTEWLEFNKPQRRKGQRSIGRLVYVHLNSRELFYLRILLCHQKGCTSFEDIRTVNDRVYETFRAACDALGLLGDDKEWDTAMKEACFSSTTSQLRSMFAQILIFYDVADPIKLWKTYWLEMSDDIPRRTSQDLHIPDLHINDPELEGSLRNREMMEEKSYDRDELAAEVLTLIPKLNEEQRKIYTLIMDSISANRQELIFVYGHGNVPLEDNHKFPTFVWENCSCCRILWHCLFALTGRAYSAFQIQEELSLTRAFAEWLLDIGNGNIGEPNTVDPQNSSWVHIPEAFSIQDDENGISKLISFIYDEHTLQNPTAQELQQKAIVCPRNDTADSINSQILKQVAGESTIYRSLDEAIPLKNDGGAVELLYPTEYLNSLQFSGFPPHELELKVGTPIMLLRNVNLQGGMCNGTRMIVKKMWSKLIEAQVITGNRMGEKVYIPRIILTTKDPSMTFLFKRKQFPIKLCYAMTINKSQGQSLNKIGVYLPEPVFSHGKQYVALSRATSPNGLRILIKQQENEPPNTTKNIVYKEFLSNIDTAHGNAIQANMGKADIAYFSSLLQDGSAYRISKFTCVPTSNYQQNLENETTLRFGRYTSFENIPADTFPKHYFNFTSYNQLDTKMQRQDTMTTQKQPTLTDYIGSLIRVRNVQTFGSAGSNLTIVRKLDIENLNGDIVELAIWDEMAKGFRKEEVDKMPKPVIFAVSSCKVSEYGGILQLLATSATHYYMNPEIPELEELHAQFAARYDLHPLLEISKTKSEDPSQEKDRNRFPLSTLLQQNPDSYKGVRFTAYATIAGINTNRDWYYEACSKCARKVTDVNGPVDCPDHGPQPNPSYRYNFKAFISDQSATTTFTFFTPNGDVMTKHECSELVKKYNNPDPRDFPPEILSLKGHQHIFQFHYNPYCEMGRIDFYFDDILDKPLQITGTDMPALKGTGMSTPGISSQLMIEAPTVTTTTEQATSPPSSVSDMPAIAIPIKHTTEASIETRGKALTTSPASTISDTSEIATPIEHITENPVTMSAPFSIDSSTLPGTLLPKSKENPEIAKDSIAKNAQPIKRALFTDVQSGHKKKKED
ncbi:DNA helicase [Tanacetum coccineum]|uniref:DNA helicase n=1 Tax=Tanacetum coccineum TaxID=301880 RepID=A0ABQ5J5Z7_9ASTR